MRIVQNTFGVLVAALLMLPAPAHAQPAINLSFGGFAVTGEDERKLEMTATPTGPAP